MVMGDVSCAFKRISVILCALLLLSGCDFLERADFLGNFKRQPKPEDSTRMSEQGLGRLAKGDFLKAQALFDQALRANPRDVHALLGKGMVYQQTGQLALARQAFEAVLSLRPGPDQRLVVMNNLKPYSVGELAGMNLALLQSQGVPSAFSGPSDRRGRVQAHSPQRSGRVPQQGLVGPQGQVPMRAPAVTPNQQMGQQMDQQAAAPQMISASDENVIARFETLKVLRDQGLITPDEYSARRNVNRGAMLKMTAPPPAAGLQRPVPSANQISQRLRAIGRALELRAITIRQHGAERTMIIDGLMPAKPKTRGSQGTPPKGLMQAAERVRGLEGLRDKGLISQDEYAKERAAIEKTLAPPPAPKPKPIAKKEAAKPASSGPKSAVHIASFRSRQAATRGWAQLRRAHRSLLGKLKSEISRVNLGRGKGVFYRLNAGPLKNQADAARVCKQLKRRRQFCEPAFMSGSG